MADAVCSLLCEAPGVDPDGELLAYRYELGPGKDDPFVVKCSFEVAEAWIGRKTCVELVSMPCDLTVEKPTSAGSVTRRVTFTPTEKGIAIRGTRTAGGSSASWDALLLYSRCSGTAPF